MRALRAVWSPFGAHDQRKRPHKLPDQAVKELAEGRPPPARRRIIHTRIPRSSGFSGTCRIRLPARSGELHGGASRPACEAGRSTGGRKSRGLPAGASRGSGSVPAAWHGHSDATPRPPLRVRSQFAVAMAVRAVRSSFASNGSALDRKSSIYPSANGAACGSLTRSGSRWVPRTRNS